MNNECRGSVAANNRELADRTEAAKVAAGSRQRDYKCVDSPGRAAALFKDAIKHYTALTRILDKINALAPYREKEAISWALSLSYSNFRKWEKEFKQLAKP